MADLPGGRADSLLQVLQQSHVQQRQQQQEQGLQQQQQQQQLNGAMACSMPEVRLPDSKLHAQIGSSGGYAQHIFAAAAQHLFGVQLQQQPLPFKVLRNADFQELQLLAPDGQALLRFATAYGFRNIQTLVRKIKSGRSEYDYIEVMACPSGCLNGGGQIKPPKGTSSAAHIEQLELLYYQQQALAAVTGTQLEEQQQQQQYSVLPGVIQLRALPPLPPQQQQSSGSCNGGSSYSSSSADWSWAVPASARPAALAAMYGVLVGGPPGSAAARGLLHTQYHQRDKTITSTIADW